MKVKEEKIFETVDKSKAEKTTDGFQNFVARLGVNARGEANNVLSAGFYEFNLVTRNRVQLEAAYRGSWIVGRVIDATAKDMTRAGIEISTNDGAEEVSEIEVMMSRLQIWQTLQTGIQWGRLYGGAIGVIQIKGQDLSKPLDLDTIGEGQFQGLAIYDRWQLNPSLQDIIDSGPEIGLPKYYEIVLGSNLNDPGQAPGGGESNQSNKRVLVHHSRCIRFIGNQLPFWQAITEMMWGESVLERMWDRLIMFDTATTSCGNLINRAQLRTVQVPDLREILGAGGVAEENLLKQFEQMRLLQQNEGITLLDGADIFASTAYSFAGLSDMMLQFGEQVSGCTETPLVILFGQSPAGLNSSGDSDIRLYYDGINAKQEAALRNPMEMILKVLWRSVTGEAAPDDLTFDFTPLWQMSALDKANISKTNTDAVIEAHTSGLISTATAMKELKQASGDTGLFTHITDEEIEEADQDEPPAPEGEIDPQAQKISDPEVPTTHESTGDPGAGPSLPLSEQKKKTGDSAWRRIKKWFDRDRNDSERFTHLIQTKTPVKKVLTRDQKRIQNFLKG